MFLLKNFLQHFKLSFLLYMSTSPCLDYNRAFFYCTLDTIARLFIINIRISWPSALCWWRPTSHTDKKPHTSTCNQSWMLRARWRQYGDSLYTRNSSKFLRIFRTKQWYWYSLKSRKVKQIWTWESDNSEILFSLKKISPALFVEISSQVKSLLTFPWSLFQFHKIIH